LNQNNDVQIIGPAVGDVLTYDGTHWIKGTPAISNTGALPSYASDSLAAAGGLPLYSFYQNSGIVTQRLV
jgi:hypothetical protein